MCVYLYVQGVTNRKKGTGWTLCSADKGKAASHGARPLLSWREQGRAGSCSSHFFTRLLRGAKVIVQLFQVQLQKARLCAAARCLSVSAPRAPHPSCPRFHQRRRACMVCRVEISISVKTYSLVTGPDRQRYFELYEQHLKTIPCRRAARGGYCPFGSACKYSYVGPADTLVQHQPRL